MVRVEPVYLTKEDVKNLTAKKIAHGREGNIYRVKRGVLYKIYHAPEGVFKTGMTPIYDSEGVNITDYKQFRHQHIGPKTLRYMDNEGNRIPKEEALFKAIERQKFITMSDLPKNVIYVDNKIKGCVLKEHYPAWQIHVIESLPLPIRIKILKKLLVMVKELLEHNIYPVDLAQIPTVEYPYTNVLFSWPFEPKIIDLDGESTVYTEYFSQKYYDKAVINYNQLCIEILTHIDSEKMLEEIGNCSLSFEDSVKIYLQKIKEESHLDFPAEMLASFLKDTLTLEETENYLTRMLKKRNL